MNFGDYGHNICWFAEIRQKISAYIRYIGYIAKKQRVHFLR